MPVFYTWPKLTAFDDKTIGSKVADSVRFLAALDKAVVAFDFSAETNPAVSTTGQGVVPITGDLDRLVYSGVGRRVTAVSEYVLREWRGEVKPFLKRRLSAPVESLNVVVYTAKAYLADPQVFASERAEIEAGGATHVIVAVLANAGPRPPGYSPTRLVANLAGGNNDAAAWDADTIRAHAVAANEYAAEWSVVAD